MVCERLDVDHDLLRQTCRHLKKLPCEFERALLSGQARCVQSQRFLVAEREGLQCQDASAQAGCRTFLQILRQSARFTLKSLDSRATWANTKNLRLQIGGLRGLRHILTESDTEATRPIEDIFELLTKAHARQGGLEELPQARIVQAIAACQPRRRR
ncbi:conserved hypothetical protein [Gammaproteobacteria bacterium]